MGRETRGDTPLAAIVKTLAAFAIYGAAAALVGRIAYLVVVS